MTTNKDIQVRQFIPTFLPNCTEIKAFFSAVFEKRSFGSVHYHNLEEGMHTGLKKNAVRVQYGSKFVDQMLSYDRLHERTVQEMTWMPVNEPDNF